MRRKFYINLFRRIGIQKCHIEVYTTVNWTGKVHYTSFKEPVISYKENIFPNILK